MTIAGFLAARLDEDEAIAKAAAGPEWGVDNEGCCVVNDEHGQLLHAEQPRPFWEGQRNLVTHVARHDPARVLREVAAKRAILAAYVQARKEYDAGEPGLALHVLVRELGECVKEMASVHSDHADYDPAWQPG